MAGVVEVHDEATDEPVEASSSSPTADAPEAGPKVIDWTGRGEAGGADAGEPPVDGGAARPAGTRRLAVVAGVVAFVYVVAVVADLVVLDVSGTAYTRWHEALGSLGARLVLCAMWLAVLYHGLDGLRVIALDLAPRLGDRQRRLRGAVGFLVFAVWIPTSLILLWPAIRWWFAA